MIAGIFFDGLAVFIIGVFSMIAAWVLAGSKNRDKGVWLVLAFLFGPLAVLLLLCFPDHVTDSPAAVAIVAPGAIASSALRRCPFCAEEIRREAIKCKHCGSDVVPEPLPATLPAEVEVIAPPPPADPDVYVVKSAGTGQAGRMRKH